MPSPIRLAREEDVPALLDIYAPYVTGTTASFEYQVPSCEEFARRLREVSACYPYLVWEEQGGLLGYAYAHAYAARPAYQWSAELTVYLRQEAARQGLGSRLYGALFDLLRLQGGAHSVRLRHRRERPQCGFPPGPGLPEGWALCQGGL